MASEPRRVLYVGCSRGQRLVTLACRASHVERVRAILARDSVRMTEVPAKPALRAWPVPTSV